MKTLASLLKSANAIRVYGLLIIAMGLLLPTMLTPLALATDQWLDVALLLVTAASIGVALFFLGVSIVILAGPEVEKPKPFCHLVFGESGLVTWVASEGIECGAVFHGSAKDLPFYCMSLREKDAANSLTWLVLKAVNWDFGASRPMDPELEKVARAWAQRLVRDYAPIAKNTEQ